jgi:lantibiotic biosynthesis protein
MIALNSTQGCSNPSALEEIEHGIVASALSSSKLSLASGLAGVLVMQAHLFRMNPTLGRAANIKNLLNRVIEEISEQELQSGLWSGLCGVLYALEFTHGTDPELLGEHKDSVLSFVEETDELLVSFVERSPAPHFDLVSGLCGIGAYALSKSDREASGKIFSAVERRLELLSDRTDDMCAWRTLPAHVPSNGTELQKKVGRYDLGLAHGTPGVIALLGYALGFNLQTNQTRTILDRAVAWLLAQSRSDLGDSEYASMFTPGQKADVNVPSRLGWCYGDLSVASALTVAARATDNVELQSYCEKLIERRLAQSWSSFKLDSLGLCHGDSGILHILKYYDSSPGSGIRQHVSHSLLQRIDAQNNLNSCKVENFGLLEGWAGIMLGLHDFMGNQPPGFDRPWNLCLLTPSLAF